MDDFRLIAARKMVWEKDLWRQPGRLSIVIRTLEQMAAGDDESPADRAEAERLIAQLYAAAKEPSRAWSSHGVPQ
jgi:hypothetical protein